VRFGRPRIRRTSGGAIEFGISDQERDVIGALLPQMQELLTVGDESLERLFPPAYADDKERDAEYQRLMRDDLLGSHFSDLDVIEETLRAPKLEPAQAEAWMRALNGLRLVIGTKLDVSEDMDPPELDDPDGPLYGVYDYLTHLVGELVEALAGRT
jgi:hypothetical protein